MDRGNTKNFNPDFLVWSGQRVIVIDTKGDHLIVEDAGRELFHVEPVGRGPKLEIRLVTEGELRAKSQIARTAGTEGYTVWLLKQGVRTQRTGLTLPRRLKPVFGDGDDFRVFWQSPRSFKSL